MESQEEQPAEGIEAGVSAKELDIKIESVEDQILPPANRVAQENYVK